MNISKYSLGTGDRFGLQGKAQLAAVEMAKEAGVELAIVWNKSHREHRIIKTAPASLRAEADEAVDALGWKGQYLVDADHINMDNVDLFIDSSDFFTLDVADYIGRKADQKSLRDYFDRHSELVGSVMVPGIAESIEVTPQLLNKVGEDYLFAIREAGKIYRHIRDAKGEGTFVTEVSMDETADPQSPLELLCILAAIADEDIPVQTIAPKFSGRFNKGVDYVGDVDRFAAEFEDDLCVIKYGIKAFGLPANLKLSVHSGSDKFSIYEPIRRLIRKHDAGLHVKTAGTTWLEEVIGLAEAGGQGLKIAKQVYASSYQRFDELCGPYESVIDIDRRSLPSPADVNCWPKEKYMSALKHDPVCPDYNRHMRQLLHVGYKVAAELGDVYLEAVEACERTVSKNVTENLFVRHITPLFIEA